MTYKGLYIKEIESMVTQMGIDNQDYEHYEDGEKCQLTFFGKEMLDKEVKPSCGCGRIYLPKEWIGKRVKVIRVD